VLVAQHLVDRVVCRTTGNAFATTDERERPPPALYTTMISS